MRSWSGTTRPLIRAVPSKPDRWADTWLTGPAKRDVNDTVAYVRRDSPKAAKAVRAKLQEAMRRLADFPNIRHAREDLADARVRVWSVYSYLIVYRPDTKPNEVLRVVHGSREPAARRPVVMSPTRLLCARPLHHPPHELLAVPLRHEQLDGPHRVEVRHPPDAAAGVGHV